MAEIKLGLTGAQVALPAITWQSGSPPTVGPDIQKAVDIVTMLDGSKRANLRTNSGASWTLGWDGITAAQLAVLEGIAVLNATLIYTDEYTDGLDHTVVVTAHPWALKAETAIRTPKYIYSLSFVEVG